MQQVLRGMGILQNPHPSVKIPPRPDYVIVITFRKIAIYEMGVMQKGDNVITKSAVCCIMRDAIQYQQDVM